MTDPFLINSPTSISFSGGRTSGYMLWRVLQAHGGTLPPGVLVTFANTGKEDEATLRFVQRVSTDWNVPIVWLEYRNEKPGYAVVSFETAARQGAPFRAMAVKRRALPNQFMRFCTVELKIKLMQNYIRDIGFGTAEAPSDTFIGIRVDEPRRVAKTRGTGGHTYGFDWIGDMLMPLADAGVTSTHVGDFWAAHPFDLELPRVNGKTLHGNCDLCFHKPPAQIVSLIKEKPERAVWWIEMEAHAKANFSKSVTSFGRGERQSYAALAEFAANQGDMFDDGAEAIPCFCGD